MASVIQIEREAYSPLTERAFPETPNSSALKHFGASQLTFLDGETFDELYFFAKVPNIEVNVQVIMHSHFHGQAYNRRVIDMNKLLSVELADVPVMLGSATFIGSVVGVAWNLVLSAPAPSYIVIVAATAGLACGRILSIKSRAHR